MSVDRYDSLIKHCCQALSDSNSGIPWELIKAMAMVGSNLDPSATTSIGRGLLALPDQLTQEYKIRTLDVFNVETNIEMGVLHMRKLLYRLSEIPKLSDRYACALAAYVSSLEYLSKSLAQARQAEGLPASFKVWRTESRKPGKWQTWAFAQQYLLPWSQEMPFHPENIIQYVGKTLDVYEAYNHA